MNQTTVLLCDNNGNSTALAAIASVVPLDVFRYLKSFLDVDTRVMLKWPCAQVQIHDCINNVATWQRHSDLVWGERYFATVHNYSLRYNPTLRDSKFTITHKAGDKMKWWLLCPKTSTWR